MYICIYIHISYVPYLPVHAPTPLLLPTLSFAVFKDFFQLTPLRHVEISLPIANVYLSSNLAQPIDPLSSPILPTTFPLTQAGEGKNFSLTIYLSHLLPTKLVLSKLLCPREL